MSTPRRPLLTLEQRSWLYAVAAALMPVLAGYGLVTEDKTLLWLGLFGAVLQTGPLMMAKANVRDPAPGEVGPGDPTA